MAKVNLLQSVKIGAQRCLAGDVVEVTEAEAATLVEAGLAEKPKATTTTKATK